MKREKITGFEMAQINSWLKRDAIDQKVYCPFNKSKGYINDSSSTILDDGFIMYLCEDSPYYCKRFFPKLKGDRCPCRQFSLSYVKRVAKELIKDSKSAKKKTS